MKELSPPPEMCAGSDALLRHAFKIIHPDFRFWQVLLDFFVCDRETRAGAVERERRDTDNIKRVGIELLEVGDSCTVVFALHPKIPNAITHVFVVRKKGRYSYRAHVLIVGAPANPNARGVTCYVANDWPNTRCSEHVHRIEFGWCTIALFRTLQCGS